jgi:hypothetical protein
MHFVQKLTKVNGREGHIIRSMVAKTIIIGSVCVSAEEAKGMRGCSARSVTFVFVKVHKASST